MILIYIPDWEASGGMTSVGSVREAQAWIRKCGWETLLCEIWTEGAWHNIPEGHGPIPPCEVTPDGIKIFRHAYDGEAWHKHHSW